MNRYIYLRPRLHAFFQWTLGVLTSSTISLLFSWADPEWGCNAPSIRFGLIPTIDADLYVNQFYSFLSLLTGHRKLCGGWGKSSEAWTMEAGGTCFLMPSIVILSSVLIYDFHFTMEYCFIYAILWFDGSTTHTSWQEIQVKSLFGIPQYNVQSLLGHSSKSGVAFLIESCWQRRALLKNSRHLCGNATRSISPCHRHFSNSKSLRSAES